MRPCDVVEHAPSHCSLVPVCVPLNLSDGNWREGSAIIDADGCDNRSIHIKEIGIKEIGQPASVSSAYNSFGDIDRDGEGSSMSWLGAGDLALSTREPRRCDPQAPCDFGQVSR